MPNVNPKPPTLTSCVVRWGRTIDDAAWEELRRLGEPLAELPASLGEAPEPKSAIDSLNLASVRSPDAEMFVVCGVARSTDGSRAGGVSLRFQRVPAGPPPPYVVESEGRIGGVAGLVAAMRRFLVPTPTVGTHFLRISIPTSSRRCRVLPRAAVASAGDGAALGLGAVATIEEIGYRYTPPTPEGIQEVAVVFRHEEEFFDVHVRAEGHVVISDTALPTLIASSRDVVLRTFFEDQS